MNRKRRKQRGRLLPAFLIFQLVLILLVSASLFYVHSLLTTYEKAQPELLVKDAVEEMAIKAADKTLLPNASAGKWESGMDIQQIFADMFNDPDTRYIPKAGLHAEHEMVYSVKTEDGVTLAEITLEAVGEPVTKLAVFTWQEWKLKSAEPVIAPKSYTLTLPKSFSASVNGIALTAEDGVVTENDSILYTIENLYFKPNVQVLSDTGEIAECSVKGDRIVPLIYDYNLTLPSSLSLSLNGTPLNGEKTADGYRMYDICVLTKPEVVISDLYGNTVNYEGGNTLPLTTLTIDATDRHSITVNGSPVPSTAVTYRANPDYEPFVEYVANIPSLATFEIAVLQNDPDIAIVDPMGNPVAWENGTRTLDLTEIVGAETLPESIAAVVNPLEIAKKWSLFVSKDLPGQSYGLYDIAQYLIPNSYQYKIATNYAYGIDITFTSIHSLGNPPFTGEIMTNYVKITDDCFSVDVSFSKHMILSNGELVDTMNERLYFVKYDNPADDWDTPTWKLASMKEMSTNAE